MGKVVLIQPSSAAAERVFSVLNACFDDGQCNVHGDYVEAAVLLRYKQER